MRTNRRGIDLTPEQCAPDDAKDMLCPYKGQPRWIHPDVCTWHKLENDLECKKQRCKRVKL
jgi:hypothetical protein